jgi:hypothetical protein
VRAARPVPHCTDFSYVCLFASIFFFFLLREFDRKFGPKIVIFLRQLTKRRLDRKFDRKFGPKIVSFLRQLTIVSCVNLRHPTYVKKSAYEWSSLVLTPLAHARARSSFFPEEV